MTVMPFSLSMFLAIFFGLGSALSSASEHTGWPHYGGSLGGGQYSSVKQINTTNVGSLQPAWILRTGELSENAARPYGFQTNPILLNGKLLLSTSSGIVIAADPNTGRELWRYDPKLDRSRRPAEIGNRGVSAWQDPLATVDAPCATRVYIGILDSRLIALDGNTGLVCNDFGKNGAIYLNHNVRLRAGDSLEYSITSPPVIVGDTLVSGSSVGDNGAVKTELGIVRGFDARTGAQRWQWDPIPRDPNTPGHVDWKPEQVLATGAANAWAPLAADIKRDLVFIPTGSASPDFYGGQRVGDNRWANSLVALQASTGELVWGQQLVHHDVWDYDLPAQPALVELERDGEIIPAVIQATKMGMLFTFHRETGQPLFAIEERPVPQSDVPGEQLSPTQPFPVAPPPVSRQHPVTEADSWGLLGFDQWLCAREFSGYRSEGIYTPPSRQGTLMLPSYGGGMNWGGIAFDPQTQTVIANSNEFATVVALIPRDLFDSISSSGDYPDSEFSHQRGTPYGMRRQPVLSVLGTPCLKPPWGTITAVDMKKGTIVWQKPLGTIEDLAPGPVPNLELGVPIMGGPIVTAGGLIFTAGAADNYLRALDLKSGKELWKGRLPAGGQATPMTYIDNDSGKQFVVIAAGGHPGLGTAPGDYVVAFALPD